MAFLEKISLPKNQISMLTDEETDVLIELFHEHDSLWNVTANYHKKEHRQTV